MLLADGLVCQLVVAGIGVKREFRLDVFPITHARGETFDLLMTDVPDLVRVAVVAPIGSHNTPHCRQLYRWLRQFQTCV